ncbi:MAG: aldose 1-epimerase [Planctomycetaceae bacterium]|nr:aldose 1-epimerase [Planctomycetaceae bacterium]
MTIVTIRDAARRSSASIAVAQGFNCFDFQTELTPGERVTVLAAADGFASGGQRPSHSGIPLLFPFPNRIRDGKYSWNGQSYELPADLVAHDANGHAIHGFALDRPWRIIDQTSDSVTGEFQISVDAPERSPLWPTDGRIRIRYRLHESCLRADIEVHNPSDHPLPWGFGTHGYFRIPLSSQGQPGDCTVYAPVRQCWKLDQCLPDGTLIEPAEGADLTESPWFDTLKLDNVYTDIILEDGISTCRIIDERGGLELQQRSSADFREIVAFTPPWTSAVCLEPYTCVTDAINLQQRGIDAGLQVLAPHATWLGRIDLEVLPLVS